MDPVAHTLAGACLAQSGLKKLTPLATATLMIAANLPDIDGITNLFGRDAALLHRRGITHGIVALALLPILLSSAIYFYDRKIRLSRNPKKSPVKFRQTLILAYIGVISHPLLDWLNTYGVRLLMPFSDQWFYGDTLFIVDMWMWLLMACAVFIAHSSGRWQITLWVTLTCLASVLVTSFPVVPLWAKFSWYLGLAAIAWFKFKIPNQSKKVARWSLLIFLAYLALTGLSKHHTDNYVYTWTKSQTNEPIEEIMTGPKPANPFEKDVLVVTKNFYYGLNVDLIRPPFPRITEKFQPVRRLPPNSIVKKALEMSEVQGFKNWMRYPTFEVKETLSEYLVIVRDLRYVSPKQEISPGIGMIQISLPK